VDGKTRTPVGIGASCTDRNARLAILTPRMKTARLGKSTTEPRRWLHNWQL